jgi:hypothetical protein
MSRISRIVFAYCLSSGSTFGLKGARVKCADGERIIPAA